MDAILNAGVARCLYDPGIAARRAVRDARGFMSGFYPAFSEHRCKNTSQDPMEDIIWVKAYIRIV